MKVLRIAILEYPANGEPIAKSICEKGAKLKNFTADEEGVLILTSTAGPPWMNTKPSEVPAARVRASVCCRIVIRHLPIARSFVVGSMANALIWRGRSHSRK